MRKSRVILQLVILFITILASLLFYHRIAFWSTFTSIGLIIISGTSHFLNQHVDKEDRIMVSFFTGMFFRLMFFLILVLFYISLRNVTEVWFVASVFMIYFSDILFELKYIVHNLRAN